MKFLFVALLIYSSSAFSQTELVKWEKADFSYRIEESSSNRDYSYHSKKPFDILLKSVTNAYWFFISDLDGNNCPFHPSCSSFLLDAVAETNIVQGTLMFFDRFTRDASFIGRYDRYPKHKSGKLYDPAYLYDLDSDHFIPAHKIIDSK
ncbi:MAG: membrane protein insertion efficiency factor YidD [Ignavibacteriaceae bacterium]|nr:membrane protein insertion efficiency factor YidD [Ignavibacteriaceae bacterium]